MAEKSGGQDSVWECIHCGGKLSGVAAGVVLNFCSLCGKKQIACINPECKKPFEEKMEICDKCSTSQSEKSPPLKPEAKVQITQCTNPDCGEPIDGDKTDLCPKCKTSCEEPIKSQIMCINLSCKEPLDSAVAETCIKCGTHQKSKILTCINPDCKNMLSSGETEVCSKCKVSQKQNLCINPECKAQLFSDGSETCHLCRSSQKPESVNYIVTSENKNGPGGQAAGSSTDPEVSSTKTFAKSTESSVDKSDSIIPDLQPVQVPTAVTRDAVPLTTLYEEEIQPGKKDSLSTDAASLPDSKKSSSDSTKMNDSGESSDSDEYVTPPPSRDPLVGTKDGDETKNEAVSDIKNLSFDANKQHRKHDRVEDTGDTDLSTLSKRRALASNTSQSSPKTSHSAGDDKSSKVMDSLEKDRREKNAIGHKDGDQESGDVQAQGNGDPSDKLKIKNQLGKDGKEKKADEHKIGDQSCDDVQAQGNSPSDEVKNHPLERDGKEDKTGEYRIGDQTSGDIQAHGNDGPSDEVKNQLERDGKEEKANESRIGDHATGDSPVLQAQGNGDPTDEVKNHLENNGKPEKADERKIGDQASGDVQAQGNSDPSHEVKHQIGKDGKEKKTDEDRIAYQASGDSPAVQAQRNGDPCDEVKNQQGNDGKEKKADKHIIHDQATGVSPGVQAQGNARGAPIDEVTPYIKTDSKVAQEESLVKSDKKNKGKEKKKKNKSKDADGDRSKDGASGISRPQTRSQTNKLDLTGFNPPPNKKLEVTFHALLPKAAWNWNSLSYMCMQFSHPRLGEWQKDVGDFVTNRDLGNGLLEMERTVAIDSDLLKHAGPIYYKYLVYFQHDDKEVFPYEMLHGAPGSKGGVVNRKLVIEVKDFRESGQYHQFDSMVYPETKKKGIVNRIVNYFVELNSKEDALLIPDHDVMQETAMKVYLEASRQHLVECQLSHQRNIVQISKHISHIFKQLHKQKISENKEYVWKADKLPVAMKAWLGRVAEDLELIAHYSQADNGKRMASALAVIVTLDSLILSAIELESVEYKLIETLFGFLCPRPNSEKKTCDDLNFVLSLVPTQSRIMVYETLNSFCMQLAHKENLNSPNWLYALPLLHFLRDSQLRPFYKLQLDPKAIPWVDKSLGLGEVRSATHGKNIGIVQNMYTSLEPLMILDPLLLTAFVYVCPKSELHSLFARIPSFFATAWLIKDVKDTKYFYKNAAEEVTKLTNVIISRQKDESLLCYQELTSTMRACYYLFVEFTCKDFKQPESYHRDSIKAIIALFLCSASRLRHFVDGNTEFDEPYDKEISSAINKFYTEVSGLFIKGYYNSFGSCNYNFFEGKSKSELKMWNMLIEFDQFEVHKEVIARWHRDVIEKTIRERLSEVQHEPMIKLFNILDSEGNVHHLITNVFMDSVMQCVEHMNMKDAASSVSLLWNSRQKQAVGKIFERILTRQYPKPECISMDDLLDWDLWPNYILIFKSEGMIEKEGKSHCRSCLPEQSSILCVCAVSTLDSVFDNILSGCITIKDLQTIVRNMDQMERLCSAATSGSLEKKGEEYDRIKMALETRQTEYKAFVNRRELLGNLCNGVDIHVSGLDKLKYELTQDYDLSRINSLCESKEPSTLNNLCFTTAAPLDSIKMYYDLIVRHHPNDIFHRVWRETLTRADEEESELSIEDIVTKIWKPAFNECCQILESLNNCSMKLSEVNDRFLEYKDASTIKLQLEKLYKGVELCHSRTPPNKCPPWINTAVERMQQYWTLCRYAKAAQTVLELREKLELTGDFSLMETIAEKMTSIMRDKPLEVIDQSLINAGDFLCKFEEDQKRLDCLCVFSDSLDVVEWIRIETKDLDDLYNFVSVALHTTAGESDFDSDRLSNLKKVGNGFGPLIYGLLGNKSFEAFCEACLDVWDSMESAPDLPEKLLGCKSELRWYKSVKETQGSIEETTFGQMYNILTYGCYIIGTRRPEMFQSIHDIVHLILTEHDKPLTKKHYSLNDIRDLESKLALIVGKNAENRTEVGMFTHTLHNVCRIADVLISLQQVGNVKYTGWRLHVPCRHDHVPMLRCQAQLMENELRKWEEEVVQKRGEFYNLNYFTTLQLLTLRQELGVFKSKPHSGPHDVTPKVLALLEGISTEVSAPRIFDTVQCVISHGYRSAASSLSTPIISNQSKTPNLTPSLSSPSVLKGSSGSGTVTEVPSLSEEILTSAGTQTASGAKKIEVDFPVMSEDDLNEEQRGIMQDVIRRYDYDSQLVLKAFEDSEDQTQYGIRNWCNENDGMFDCVEESQDDEEFVDEEDDIMSNFDEEEFCHHQQATPHSTSASSPKILVSPGTNKPVVASGIRQIEAQPQLPIDGKHPVVQQLCSAGYSEELSLEAVERFETLEGAMDYLMSQDDDDGGELFQIGSPNRQDSMSVMRQSSGGARYVEPLDPQYCDSEPTIHCDPNPEKSYLSLEELGHVLTDLTQVLQSRVVIPRTFNTKILKCGHPNLIVTLPDNVLKTVLALFMEDEVLPLPTLEEVLICNSTTTAEEVTLLWQRAIDDPEFKRIFCLVHAERLTYQVSDRALRSLSELSQGSKDYRLVIICSNEEEEKSHIISKLHSCRRPFSLTIDTEQCKRYLKIHFTGQVESVSSSQIQPAIASNVDHENSCVRLVTSWRSGMGKSLFIMRMVEQLQMNVRSTKKLCVTIPLHGPKVSPDTVLNYLQKYMQESTCTIYHLDIAPSVLSEVDTILFSLLVLRGLIDSQGRVWRYHPGQLYAVELTLPEKQKHISQVGQTLALTELLPSVHCVSPRQSMELMTEDGTPDPSMIVMDEQIFAQPICQRVYQYLRRHMNNLNLDNFSYIDGNVEGSKKNCLDILLQNCGIRDPSWCEVRHFIDFLEIQLRSCEQSVFCDETFIDDIMSGLKSFVVKFMIRMSRDFATSSLQGEVARENLEDVEVGGEASDNIEQYQIAERRRWERNSHPYIFFNDDRASITFVGFMVTRNGDLVDPTHRGVLEHGIMTPELYTGLKHNQVNFDEDFRQWPKNTMIEKIATVMGIDFPHDPDETYVLTVDNLIKILAIQMRFRCGIPVVIMGETGCGKTRLIRYMCDLARQGEDQRNMLIMKVHGGTTEKDIDIFMKRAEMEAEQNQEKNIDTVVFFDEANTTDAIGLIKEIMCDRRIHGKTVSRDLKFIAACNPYRKHSEDMIKKLENAGLGFYVRESDTQQKLGKIPLRQLVYRVLDLPSSMRHLVYDFGQLQQTTEDDYIRQIVHDHVTNHAGLSQEPSHYITAIAKVLAWSQDYMRGHNDECSFVSLRDVERAMIVFKYFYDKIDMFAPLKCQEDDNSLASLVDEIQQEDEDRIASLIEENEQEDEDGIASLIEENEQEDEDRIDALFEENEQEDEDRIDALFEENEQEDEDRIDALFEENEQEDEDRIDALFEENEQEDEDRIDALIDENQQEYDEDTFTSLIDENQLGDEGDSYGEFEINHEGFEVDDAEYEVVDEEYEVDDEEYKVYVEECEVDDEEYEVDDEEYKVDDEEYEEDDEEYEVDDEEYEEDDEEYEVDDEDVEVDVEPEEMPQAIGKITKALILSLSVCYHARLQHRTRYEKGVSQQFINPLYLPGGDRRFRDEITCCQKRFLDNMRLGENIAKNAALRENVFMMAICIELRIPLFLVGKPGSSKSLAKAVIHASMRGKGSNTELLRGFKEVDMFSYQCSQLSTPESVIEVFNTASRFQRKQDTKSCVAVVVLDEVGLAEDSPNLPLKALHPLLEDGTEGASAEGRSDMIIAREERVAFIGISNWALDPAKMNRGVMLTRGDPSKSELEFSAEGICSNKEDDPVKARLKQYFKPLSEAYMKICKDQNREFYGLRDFYSLIKMLYWMCEKSGCPPTWPQLEHAIKRNFGGLESKDLDPIKVFMDKLPCKRETPDLSGIPENLHSVVSPDCTRFGLIQASLGSKERTWHGENRYLLFLTENYAALDILKHYLSGVDSSKTLNRADVKLETMEPFVLFGSSFPKDKEYTQVCRNINQIKICMETGRTVILLNLENLYESLYDVLNQYYIYNSGNRYVDLGLQTHRVRCRVHDDFKLILIAEKDKVYEEFPTPLINRLEKHFVLTSSVLEAWQEEVLNEFEAWISNFCNTRGKKFSKGNAFIGYQKDTPAAVVFQASNFLRRMREDDKIIVENKEELLHRAGILDKLNMSLNTFLDNDDNSEQWKAAVLLLSQFLLLRTATPDAVIRLKTTSLEAREEIAETYFKKLHHHCIEVYLRDQIEQNKAKGGLLMQITTRSHLLAHDELEQVKRAIGIRVESCSLHEFETELDFTTKIGPYFKRSEEEKDQSVLIIIQCDSGYSNRDLIACARNRIYDVRSEMEGDTHVALVIHLSHQAVNSSFISFQGDPWMSVHIDDLKLTSDSTILLYEAMETAISQLFLGNITPNDWFSSLTEEGDTSNEKKEEGNDIEMDCKPSKPLAEQAADAVNGQIPPMEIDENDRVDEDELPTSEERMSESSQSDHSAEEVMEEDNLTTTITACDEQPKQLTLLPQCHRLHSCIQAAASKLQDDNKRRATQRVEILVNLVPMNNLLPLDLSSFHGIIIQHIFSVLKQRDQVWEVDKQWVLNEAMDARKLQNGGPFRNVLARKIDDVVVPIFSEIIAFMDRNYNLDLINQNNTVRKFWLNMFGRPNIMQFNYVEMITSRKNVPGVGGRRSAKDFKCQLPFSWIIKAAYDDHWDNAKSLAGNNREALHKQLCEAINQVEVGEVLKSVDDEYCEEFYKYYLHDFVRSVHQSQHKKQEQEKQEYDLIGDALDDMVHGDGFSSIDGHDTLIKRMAALHVVYMFNKSQIMWFGQLVSQNPSIMLSLKDKKSPDTSEMTLHHFAVEKVLEQLKPPMEKDKLAEHLLPWLNDLRLSRNAIDSILSLPPCNAIVERARLNWQLIQAMQMFLEHVLLKHPEVPVTFARRLELFLMSCSDFLKGITLVKVKKHLNTTHNQLRSKYRSRPKIVASIRKSCREFFMEVVSNLCFGGHKPPEPDLIKMLMDTVFTAKKDLMDTRDMTPYQVDPDQVPVIRSFLLQLLLEHNSEQVKEHLKDYFERSRQAFGRQTDQDLCLLCIQCFEDALCKDIYEKCFAKRVEETTTILEDGCSQLKQHTHRLNLDYLEGVAKVRFAMSVVAELLNQSDQPRSQEDSALVVQLLQQAKEICTDLSINTVDTTGRKDTVGPVVYLIKLLMRQYGLNCLQTAAEEHRWIIPEVIKNSEKDEKTIDPFVIYNEVGYNHLREAVSEAAYGKQLPKLIESTKTLNVRETVPLLLALYQKITLCRASTQLSEQILPDVLGEFNQLILKCKVLPKEIQRMARSLITNKQGGPFPLLSVAPRQSAQCRTLTALVVHTTAVFLSRQKIEVLWPFLSMLTDQARLANAYLPTMEEDHFQEVRMAIGHEGVFYSCPRGHPYFVGECGQPMQERTCLTCGARIGGIDHNLRTDNTLARLYDTTQTGHDLGDPNSRTTVPAPERTLSPPAVCVLRALMHSAFLWACCNNEQNIGNIVQLVKPHVPIQALPEFFWRHLDKDIELLGRAVGKGYEEAAMTVHLVLKQILTKDPPTSDIVGVSNTLSARNARTEWEKIFNDHYIQPVLGSLEQKIDIAIQTIVNDGDQEHDQLFFLVYERMELVNQSSIQPHLWTYRSRITLEHLAQTLQEKKMKDRHPILYEFLQVEPVLRATQYLPDIVRLQQCLYDAFHHRLDKTDAMRQTVGEFLNRLTSENARNEYQEKIGSLQKAWALVGHMLKNHARLRVNEKYLIPSITLDTTLEYLIPTTTDAGACTTALVDFLVLSHNNFVEKCRSTASNDEKSAAFWRKHEVPITHIHRCHLVDYELQLLSIVLSHCNYSLTFGKGQSIKYNHTALEKHILDRFIHGKPKILSDIPHVVYRKDIYTTVTFATVRKKVKKQEELGSHVKQEILSELRTTDLLRKSLDVVDIVLGFLSSGGGKADKPLGEYIDRLLKMRKRPFSTKAREYCCLGHVMSLWETISVELAKQHYIAGEEPFDLVEDSFLEPLEEEAKFALEKCLRLFDLESLLGTLYEFIETHVKHSPKEELQWPVKGTLEGFLDRSDLPKIKSFDEFPDDINISQAIAAWKCIVDYQDKVKQ